MKEENMGIMIVVGVVFLAVGLALLLVGINQGKKAKAAEAWPTVPGVMLSSGLKENRSYDSETHRTSVTYEPQVQYQYSLMGQTYQGDHLAFGKAGYGYNTASKKIAPYAQGANVVVHYDPADPSKAVLETKAAGGVLMIVIGAIFLVIGLIIAILGLAG